MIWAFLTMNGTAKRRNNPPLFLRQLCDKHATKMRKTRDSATLRKAREMGKGKSCSTWNNRHKNVTKNSAGCFQWVTLQGIPPCDSLPIVLYSLCIHHRQRIALLLPSGLQAGRVFYTLFAAGWQNTMTKWHFTDIFIFGFVMPQTLILYRFSLLNDKMTKISDIIPSILC